MSTIKITYFPMAGRAEVARQLLTIGGVPFEDVRIARDAWMELKPKTPMGQLPILEVDGAVLCQSAAIDRYCAQKAGLLPSDPWLAARADELYFSTGDVMEAIYKTFPLPDEEKIAARKKLLEGGLKTSLNNVAALLAKAPEGEFAAGAQPTHGDLALYSALSFLKSGNLDGIPTDVLTAYPALEAFHKRCAAVPAIAKYLEAHPEPTYNSFRA